MVAVVLKRPLQNSVDLTLAHLKDWQTTTTTTTKGRSWGREGSETEKKTKQSFVVAKFGP